MMWDDEPNDGPRSVGAFGATLILLGLIVGTFAGMAALAHVVARLGPATLTEARNEIVSRPIFGALAQVIAGTTVLLVARRVYHPGRSFVAAYGLRYVSGSTLALAALVGVAVQFPLAELGNLIEHLVPIPLAEKQRLARILAPESFGEGLALAVSVVVFAPLTEELVFRGLLLPGIARGSGIVVGIVISTLGFALSHGRPTAVIVAFCAGLLLAALTYRHVSVLPAIAMHAAHNAMPVLLPSRVIAIPGWNLPTAEPAHIAPSIWLPSLTLAAAAFYFAMREPADA